MIAVPPRAAIVAVWLIAFPSAVATHPAPFSYLDIRIDDTVVDGALVLHDFDVAHDVGVDPPELLRDPAVAERFRDQLTRLMQSRLDVVVDRRMAELTWVGFESLPERQSVRLTFRINGRRPAALRVRAALFPYDPVHQTFVNVYENGALRHQAILSDERRTADYYAGNWQGTAAVLGVFIPAGVEHILIGPDHVLFLVGLLLLGGTIWRLATIVTAFTIGHSITLSLAALDVISPPALLVEPVIALSIVFVGVDNLLVLRDEAGRNARGQGDGPSVMTAPRDIRAWIAGVFGLVHGFGFASVLKELGLPITALGWSLFSFNLGVELGQLAIVAAVALALQTVARRSAHVSRRVAIGGSVIVVAAGAYWFIERMFLT